MKSLENKTQHYYNIFKKEILKIKQKRKKTTKKMIGLKRKLFKNVKNHTYRRLFNKKKKKLINHLLNNTILNRHIHYIHHKRRPINLKKLQNNSNKYIYINKNNNSIFGDINLMENNQILLDEKLLKIKNEDISINNSSTIHEPEYSISVKSFKIQNNLKNIDEMFGNNISTTEKLTNIQADFKLHQNKKFTRHNRKKNLNKHKNWWIPFTYSFGSVRSLSGQTIRQFWINNQTICFIDIGLKTKQYLLANPYWIYPYKVNYDLNNWKLLIDQVCNFLFSFILLKLINLNFSCILIIWRYP